MVSSASGEPTESARAEEEYGPCCGQLWFRRIPDKRIHPKPPRVLVGSFAPKGTTNAIPIHPRSVLMFPRSSWRQNPITWRVDPISSCGGADAGKDLSPSRHVKKK
ncbi:hypothetical protein R1flu_022440 [Riccia fluitans]|uniref:Uncharacterized protein n=1 Tax=Riccia fluitans TaxID=41844 RepID=A0ABD1XP71_9MARC